MVLNQRLMSRRFALVMRQCAGVELSAGRSFGPTSIGQVLNLSVPHLGHVYRAVALQSRTGLVWRLGRAPCFGTNGVSPWSCVAAMGRHKRSTASGAPVTWSFVLMLFLIAIGWGAPLWLRETDAVWEPYPSLLFPGGGSVVDVRGDEVSVSALELLSVSADGREHRLNPAEFFEPLPEQYWNYVARRGFGLGSRGAPLPRLSIARWSVSFERDASVAPSERLEVESWLRERLAKVGRGEDRRVRVRAIRMKMDTVMHREVSRRTLWTYDVPL